MAKVKNKGDLNRRGFISEVTARAMGSTLLYMYPSFSAEAKSQGGIKKNVNLKKYQYINDIAFAPLYVQSQLIRQKKISSEELVKIYLTRIKEIDQKLKLNTFVHLNEELALKNAKAADELAAKNKWLGPLHGLVVSLKDDLETKDQPMTAGTKFLKNWQPQSDAFVVSKLKNNGVVFLGKTNLEEFTFGVFGQNEVFGNVKNPFDISRSSGGSSAGSSVAVASGFCSAALGSDASGSVRIPAASCGVYGFRPTMGLISRNGLTPFIPTKDTIGCLSRSAYDISLMVDAMQGYDSGDELTLQRNLWKENEKKFFNFSKIKFGILSEAVLSADQEIRDILTQFTKKLKDEKIEIRDLSFKEYSSIIKIGGVINFVEHRTWIELLINKTNPEVVFQSAISEMQKTTQRYIKAANEISSFTYCLNLQDNRKKISMQVEKLFDKTDILVLPTIGMLPPELQTLSNKDKMIEKKDELALKFRTPTELPGLLGLPAITIPIGLNKDKMPVAVQLIAKKYEDYMLLKVAEHLEDVLGNMFVEPQFSTEASS